MKILINGIGGRMGVEVKKMVLDGYRGATLCAGVDINDVDISEAPPHLFERSPHAHRPPPPLHPLRRLPLPR